MASSLQPLLCRLSSLHRLVSASTNSIHQQCLSRCMSQLSSQPRFTAQRLAAPLVTCHTGIRSFHTTQSNYGSKNQKREPRVYEDKNKRVYPPQLPGEPRRPAEIYFAKRQIKYSDRKMWYVANFVKGMMIDDAISQLALINKKGARIAREVLLEAQEEAMANHNVEYKSNLHIAESFVGKGKYDHAIRFHGRGFRFQLDLVYCHYFVCLREGPPPEEPAFTGYDHAERYMERLRYRYIRGGL